MKSLRCDLSDGFYIAVKESSAAENQEKKRNSSYLLQLFGKSEAPIATKVIPWPSNEESPSEVLYSSEEGVVKVKSSLTVAEIPMRLDKLTQPRQEEDGGFKRYKSFASAIPESDSSKVIASIRSVSDSPTSKSEWKNLQKLLVPGMPAVPLREQEMVIAAIPQMKETKYINEICTSILQSKILGYRKQQELANFCIENGLIEFVIADLQQGSYSEDVKARILSHITSIEKSEAMPILETVLKSGFSTEQLGLSGKIIPAKAAAQLLEWLSELYADFSRNDIHSQVLSMFSALLDATGSQLTLENDTQTSISNSIELITDFAALTDVFSLLSVSLKNQDVCVKTEVEALFRLRKLKIQPRKLVW